MLLMSTITWLVLSRWMFRTVVSTQALSVFLQSSMQPSDTWNTIQSRSRKTSSLLNSANKHYSQTKPKIKDEGTWIYKSFVTARNRLVLSCSAIESRTHTQKTCWQKWLLMKKWTKENLDTIDCWRTQTWSDDQETGSITGGTSEKQWE